MDGLDTSAWRKREHIEVRTWREKRFLKKLQRMTNNNKEAKNNSRRGGKNKRGMMEHMEGNMHCRPKEESKIEHGEECVNSEGQVLETTTRGEWRE